MDPVSVFNALYDTKCLKFGRFELKSGLVAPYYINLRRLPLYPKLMEAVVGQVVERHLTGEAVVAISSQLRKGKQSTKRQSKCCEIREDSGVSMATVGESLEAESKRLAHKLAHKCSTIESDSDADSQLEEEDEEEEQADSASNLTSDTDDWAEKLAQGPTEPFICGVPYGAVPLATAIAFKAQLPLLFERKDPKTYGDPQPLLQGFVPENEAEGAVGEGQLKRRVILIEDVISSGASVLECIRNLERMNLKVEFVIGIVDREENGARLLMEQAGVKVVSLYNMSAILRVLEVTGRISREEYLSARQWMAKSQFKAFGVDPSKGTDCKQTAPSAIQQGLATATN